MLPVITFNLPKNTVRLEFLSSFSNEKIESHRI